MQILNIVLYSHDGRTRTITLRPGEVNIVTGRSRTGKSALMPIIQYCLGSGTIKIPVNVIRYSVAWYALHLLMPDGSECFIARREPGHDKAASPEIYVEVGSNLTPPNVEQLHKNYTKESLDAFLSARIGIANIEAEPGAGSSRVPYQIDFSHTQFFNYQDQNEIANKSILFHRQAEEGMPYTIRDVLPYFLGAEDEDRLLQKRQLRNMRQELRKMQRESIERSNARDVVSAKAASLVAEAENMGVTVRGAASPVEALRALAKIHDPASDHTRIGDELARLEDERERLLQAQRVLKGRLRTYNSLLTDGKGYTSELQSQRARLQSVGLLNGVQVQAQCPLCESSLRETLPSVRALQESIETLDKQLNQVRVSQPRLEEAIAEATSELNELRSNLNSIDVSIMVLENRNEELTARRRVIDSTAYLRGRISAYLETVNEESGSKDFDERLSALAARVSELEASLHVKAVKERLDSIVSIMSLEMSAWAKELDLEYGDKPVRLDLQRLTVVAETKHGHVLMDQIGSAANWLGFHLVAFAALHKWFVENDRPIPRFIFLDQPTQAFYSAQRAAGKGDDEVRVRQLYDFILQLPERLGHRVQIIVIDHEDRDDRPFASAVSENWHEEGKALIPSDWPRVG